MEGETGTSAVETPNLQTQAHNPMKKFIPLQQNFIITPYVSQSDLKPLPKPSLKTKKQKQQKENFKFLH